jgi:hypothetical protein
MPFEGNEALERVQSAGRLFGLHRWFDKPYPHRPSHVGYEVRREKRGAREAAPNRLDEYMRLLPKSIVLIDSQIGSKGV